MGDPLSDPRAQKLLSASPGEISSLAASFRMVGTQAEVAAAGLRGAQGDATWTGQAASAFRAQVGKLPGQLDQVQHSYNEAGTALYQYESQLSPIQSQFRSLATQLTSARSTLSSAQGALSTASSAYSSASTAPNAKPNSTAVTQAHNALTVATSNANQAQDEVSQLEAQGFRILDDFDTVRGQARSKVSSAAAVAPQHHTSWLMGAIDAVGNALGDAGKFLFNVGKGIVDDIGNLPDAVYQVYEHPGNLKDWGNLVKDVAVTASVVALVAAPFAAPEILEADAGVDGAGAVADATDAAAEEGGDDAAESAAKTGFDRLRTPAARVINTGAGRVANVATASGVGIELGQGDYRGAAIDAAVLAVPSLASARSSVAAIGDAQGVVNKVGATIDVIKGPGDMVSNGLGIGENAADAAAENLKALTALKEPMENFETLRTFGFSTTEAEKAVFGDNPPSALSQLNLNDANSLGSATQAATTSAQAAAARNLHLGGPVAGLVDKVGVDPLVEKAQHRFDPAFHS